MKKNVLVFGLISGALISLFMVSYMAVCYRSTKFEGSMVVGYSAMLLALSVIFVAVKNYRDKYNGGVVSFGKAFRIGLFISLISSTIYLLSWAIEYHFFMPDWMDKYAAHTLETMRSSGASASEVADQTKEINAMKDSYQNPIVFALYTYAEILPVGLLVSLITALILKKKSNTGEVAAA
jgi:hypothetical protein